MMKEWWHGGDGGDAGDAGNGAACDAGGCGDVDDVRHDADGCGCVVVVLGSVVGRR